MSATTNQFRVEEMTSVRDAQAIAHAVQRVRGVQAVHANLAERSLRVQHEPGLPIGALIAAINRAGYHHIAVLV